MYTYVYIFVGQLPTLRRYNIEPTCCIVKNDCISSYTKLTNNVYRLCMHFSGVRILVCKLLPRLRVIVKQTVVGCHMEYHNQGA